MSRRIVALLLVALMSTVAAQDKTPGLSIIVVEASSYTVDESKARSLDEVIADLRKNRTLQAVGIEAEPGVAKERIDALVAAIRKSGLTQRIGVVGNEVFTQ